MEDERLISKESDGSDVECRMLQSSQRRLKRWIAALSMLLSLSVLALFFALNRRPVGDQRMAKALTPVPSSKHHWPTTVGMLTDFLSAFDPSDLRARRPLCGTIL